MKNQSEEVCLYCSETYLPTNSTATHFYLYCSSECEIENGKDMKVKSNNTKTHYIVKSSHHESKWEYLTDAKIEYEELKLILQDEHIGLYKRTEELIENDYLPWNAEEDEEVYDKVQELHSNVDELMKFISQVELELDESEVKYVTATLRSNSNKLLKYVRDNLKEDK